MNIVLRYLFSIMYVLLSSRCIFCATITFVNNSHWAPIRLQIAIDADPLKATVRGHDKESPLEQHAAIEITDLTILPENKFSIRTPDDQLLHVRIASYGHERKSQIMITVFNNTEIDLNDFGKDDIFIERDIKVVNTTDKIVHVQKKYTKLETDWGNSRQGWEYHPSSFSGIPWRRQPATKIFDLLPLKQKQDDQGVSRAVESNQFNFKLHLMSYTDTRGSLAISCPDEWTEEAPWSFDGILPLSGSRSILTIRDRACSGMFVLARVLHDRLGADSPACLLNQHLFKDISDVLPRQPYIVATYQ